MVLDRHISLNYRTSSPQFNQLISSNPLTLHSQGTPAYTLLATSPPGAKQRGRPHEPDFVGILLTLIRLEEKQTDLVVSINVPHLAGQYVAGDVEFEKGKLGFLMERARGMREVLMGSLEVREWGLFV